MLPAAAGELLEQAAATGLMHPDGEVAPLVRHALLRVVPPAHRLVQQRRLAEIELGRGGSVLAVARGLLGTGATGAKAAAVFVAAGDEALRTGDRSAGELFAAATRAGAPALELAARRAEAAVHAGDLDLALAQADQVLAAAEQVPHADAVRAGTAAAAVLARRGLLARSAALYRWMGGPSGATVAAVPALIGTGALPEARNVLLGPAGPAPGRPPTLLEGAEELMARGIYDSVCGSPTAALSQLARAAGLLERSHRAALLPDTPAALAALVAVHCGELDVAQSVLERAVRVGLGGLGARAAPAAPRRIALLRGGPHRPPAPHGCGRPGTGAAGAARRAGGRGARGGAGPPSGRSRGLLCRVAPGPGGDRPPPGRPVRLAAARRAVRRSHPAEGAGLGAAVPRRGRGAARPVGRSAAVDGVAALVGAAVRHRFEAGAEAQRHADALAAGSATSRYAAAVAAAGREWLRSLAGDVDADAVEAAARGLHAAGLGWEGGRLAGQAAIRTRDRKAMKALLGCARALQGGTEPPAAPSEAVPGGAQPVRRVKVPEQTTENSIGAISDREREVAELVLSGLTYKQIGEQLFISAKTVENHVARMRQRLGSGSRGELFAHLRMLVGESR